MPGGVDWGRRGRPRWIAGRRHEGRRSEVAQAEARRPEPADLPVAGRLALRPDRASEVLADPLGARQPAGDVVADMGHDRWPRLRRVERVERRDAVGLGGRHGESLRDVVEGRLADPADPVLDRVERRQQLGPSAAQRVPATGAWPSMPAPSRRPPTQPDSGGPRTASTAARSAGEARGPMTCRSIAPSVAGPPGQRRSASTSSGSVRPLRVTLRDGRSPVSSPAPTAAAALTRSLTGPGHRREPGSDVDRVAECREVGHRIADRTDERATAVDADPDRRPTVRHRPHARSPGGCPEPRRGLGSRDLAPVRAGMNRATTSSPTNLSTMPSWWTRTSVTPR